MTPGTSSGRFTRRAFALGAGTLVAATRVFAQESTPAPVVSLAGMPVLDDSQGADLGSIWLRTLLYDAPLAFTSAGTLAGAIAIGWNVDDDGRHVELTIRRDVLFSDESPVRAADVAASIRRVADPATQNFERWRFQAVESVEAIDDDRVVLALDWPDVSLLTSLATVSVPVVPEDWASATDLEGVPGSGPFLVNADVGDGLLLRRHPAYRQVGRPRLSQVLVRRSDASDLRATELATREVDVLIDVPLLDVPTLRQDPQVTLHGGSTDRLAMLVVNDRAPALADPALRHLLAAAIDRESLIQGAVAGEARSALRLLPPAHWAAGDGDLAIDAEPADAVREELRGLGYSPGLRLRLMVSDETPTFINACVLLQDQLAYAGFALDLDLLTPAEMPQAIANGDFDLTIAYSPFWRDPHEFFCPMLRSDGPRNVGGFASARVDRLIDRGVEQSDLPYRMRAYVRLQGLLAASMPLIPLFWANYYDAVAPSITGYEAFAPVSALGLRGARHVPETPPAMP